MTPSYIDTHCHLYLPEFVDDIHSVIQRAEKEGVNKFFLPAIDRETESSLLMLEQLFPGKCFAMMGLHPCSVKENYKAELKWAEAWLEKREFAAIGETGLDFYWDRTFLNEQVSVFEQQIEWARHYDRPVVIHSRNALDECIRIIKARQDGRLQGIFHCFSGTNEQAQAIIDTGFYLGLGGVITYKNAGLAEVVANISLDHVVLETDAPYLTPVPYRGKRNESSYLKYVVEKLGMVKNTSPEEVGRITTRNAQNLFRL
jgi:TatD DNase family protein